MQVLSWPSRFAIHSPVVSTLARLFQALDQEEKEPGTGHVSPNELRKALSALPGELFRVGEMNDAGEVLLKIYDCIKGESREVGRREGCGLLFMWWTDLCWQLHLCQIPIRERIFMCFQAHEM